MNTVLCAVRGVAKAAWSLGLMTSEDYTRVAAVKGLRGSRLPSGRALSAGEVTALFDACFDDERAAGRRDAAILALLLGAGLRRAECAGLALSDYNPGSSEREGARQGRQATAHAVRGKRRSGVKGLVNGARRLVGPSTLPSAEGRRN